MLSVRSASGERWIFCPSSDLAVRSKLASQSIVPALHAWSSQPRCTRKESIEIVRRASLIRSMRPILSDRLMLLLLILRKQFGELAQAVSIGELGRKGWLMPLLLLVLILGGVIRGKRRSRILCGLVRLRVWRRRRSDVLKGGSELAVCGTGVEEREQSRRLWVGLQLRRHRLGARGMTILVRSRRSRLLMVMVDGLRARWTALLVPVLTVARILLLILKVRWLTIARSTALQIETVPSAFIEDLKNVLRRPVRLLEMCLLCGMH